METTKLEIENSKREKLKREKPLVFEKILKIEERFKAGMATPVIDICYNRACNLKCQHCFTTRFVKKDRSLTPFDLKKLSDEAHELGLCQFVISGGEPLILNNIKDVVVALQPEKFHLSISRFLIKRPTNAWMGPLTRRRSSGIFQVG